MAAERDRSREITAGVDIQAPDSQKPADAGLSKNMPSGTGSIGGRRFTLAIG
jgi:hypothetical protein